MKIGVLLKSVVATEEPICVKDGKIAEDGAKRVINPYDEYALEEALRLTEAGGGVVTVLSIGGERTAETLRTALAMGADDAVWIREEDDEGDEHTRSLLLAEAVRRSGCELLIAGHLSVDNGAGQVAIRVAELLGWPHAGAIVQCERQAEGGLRIVRDAEGDSETWELPLPAVLTAQQGLNEPRYPALAGIMKAKRKPLAELPAAELGLAGALPLTERLGCLAPPQRPPGRRLGGTPEEQAAELAAMLRNEAKVLKER
jgi:electron transfer flavoprotein beta subunit